MGQPTSGAFTIDDSKLDTWTDTEPFTVTRERIIEYAKATNDPIPAHLAGDIGPPVFAIVPVFNSMMKPVLNVVPAPLLPRVVHGQQDFRFHRPIKPGDSLISRGKMVGYENLEKATRALVLLECRTAEGELVTEQYVTSFFRGFGPGTRAGLAAPEHGFDDRLRATAPLASVDQHVDLDQTFRYSPASGDPMPIHLDEGIARGAGLPGIIAHGLCTMAIASWAILTTVAGSDTGRLTRLAVRFSKMVLPGDDLQTRIWQTGNGSYSFETARGQDLVLTDGLAVFAD